MARLAANTYGGAQSLLGNKEFFFDPRLKINKIATELITINKLALVKEISTEPNLISGPIR